MINVHQISQRRFRIYANFSQTFHRTVLLTLYAFCPEMTITVNLQVFSGKYFRVGCLTVTDPGDSDIIKTHTAAEQK